MPKTFRETRAHQMVNRFMRTLIRLGIAPQDKFLLTVKGRKTGKLYSTPVTLVRRGDQYWLVAPYGIVNWVKNARAAGEVTLTRGKLSRTVPIIELGAEESAPVLQEYLKIEPITRPYFTVTPDAPLEAFIVEAPLHPVFKIQGLKPAESS
jgi:deazaflavin-dependent oxidoreductase (nitroreductase family)